MQNNVNGKNNQNTNNAKNYNKKMDIIDLPRVFNQNNPQNNPINPINYRYAQINYKICCPQIQPINAPVQKPVNDKITNNSNYLPDTNNKENNSSINDTKTKKKYK